MSRKQRKGKKDQRKHGTVDQHARQGKMLHAALARIYTLQPSSWVDERLPDQIFSALLMTRLDRMFALDLLRQVAYLFRRTFQRGQNLDLTLTGLAAMPAELAQRAIASICETPAASQALEPLLWFDDLPGRERWTPYVGQGIDVDSWRYLAGTVSEVLFHQSQSATDARWARVLFRVSTGQYVVAPHTFEWYTRYPNEGDQRLVRPSIRASEIAEDPQHDYSERKRWAESFWSQCLRHTPCGPYLKHGTLPPRADVNRGRVFEVLRKVAEAASATTKTTGRDARHAAAFGLVSYALNILVELYGIGVAQGVLGRLALRAIFEAYVTLLHLVKTDDGALWEDTENTVKGRRS